MSQSRKQFVGGDALRAALWERMKAKASYVMSFNGDERLAGDVTLTADEVAMVELESDAAGKEPYGDVHYCDDGMQSDGKKRFPCDTPEHIRAAWSYSHHANVTSKYTSSQLAKLHACIERAWKDKIDPKGPPSADKS